MVTEGRAGVGVDPELVFTARILQKQRVERRPQDSMFQTPLIAKMIHTLRHFGF